ncbi:transporter [Naematelia encephala]|uniref:Transporter n=1 Tax=Naematelia encephala TaxID=71784 RepID=A0A1Y2BIB9_9TREE|nr:transporter [Naematelia encephala]
MSALPTERTPLVQDSSTTDDVTPAEEEKLHYNLAGLSRGSFWILCISVWMCAFLGAFDGTVVATLLGSISSSFYATNLSSWLGTSYMLTVCCFTPIYGRLCNIIGRQTTMLIALTIFGVGNALCAVAPSMKFLIAARAFAGLGGGGLATTGSTIMSDLVPITHRGIFQGYANIMFGLGGALGAPIGGFINDYLGWRWAFLFQIPVFVFAFIMIYFKVRYTVAEKVGGPGDQTAWQALKRIDFAGSLLLAGWVGAGLIAVSLKTNSTAADAYSWSDPTIVGLFVASGVLFIVFLFVELRFAAEPVMPFELLHRPTPVAIAINNFLISIAMYSVLYSVPLFLTAVRQMSSANAGGHMMPSSLAGTIGSIGVGFMVRHTGRYYWLTIWTGAAAILGTALMATWSVDTPDHMFWWNMTPFTFSMGAVTTLTVVALIADVGREHVAVATSLSYVFRTTGQVLGVSLTGALTQAILQKQLSERITGPGAEETIALIRESSDAIQNLPPAIKAAAIASYDKAIHAVFVVCVVVCVLQLLVVLGVKEVNMLPPPVSKPDDEAEETV